MRTFWKTDFRPRDIAKNNFSGIDISQGKPWIGASLSASLFSLDRPWDDPWLWLVSQGVLVQPISRAWGGGGGGGILVITWTLKRPMRTMGARCWSACANSWFWKKSLIKLHVFAATTLKQGLFYSLRVIFLFCFWFWFLFLFFVVVVVVVVVVCFLFLS